MLEITSHMSYTSCHHYIYIYMYILFFSPANGADCENNAAIANGMSPTSITNHDISSNKIVP